MRTSLLHLVDGQGPYCIKECGCRFLANSLPHLGLRNPPKGNDVIKHPVSSLRQPKAAPFSLLDRLVLNKPTADEQLDVSQQCRAIHQKPFRQLRHVQPLGPANRGKQHKLYDRNTMGLKNPIIAPDQGSRSLNGIEHKAVGKLITHGATLVCNYTLSIEIRQHDQTCKKALSLPTAHFLACPARAQTRFFCIIFFSVLDADQRRFSVLGA